jgi:uncharacterized cofD-like protein
MSDARPRQLVAIGGGHGLARTLGAARRLEVAISAVVSVADDGGSSGRLREVLDIPAPGDLRKCLSALLPSPSPLGEAFEYRFVGGDLDGHAFGNLFLAALASTCADFPSAVAEACRILETVGEVIPATAVPVDLQAHTARGAVTGQVEISAAGGIERLVIVPEDAEVPERALHAIKDAEIVVIGPGSLFTSVLAACVPPAITAAIASTGALRIYICNLREQLPETSGYDVGAHVSALCAHGIVPDVVIADSATMALGAIPDGVRLVDRPLAQRNGLAHDETLLADAIAAALA